MKSFLIANIPIYETSGIDEITVAKLFTPWTFPLYIMYVMWK